MRADSTSTLTRPKRAEPAAARYRDRRAAGRELVCARIPRRFHSVGELYDDFTPVDDEEVRRLLRAAQA
jgi:predicted phosphoribosyltransferase